MHEIKRMVIGFFILVAITSAGLSLNLISMIPAQAQMQTQSATQNNTVPANSNTTAQGKPVLVHIASGNSNNTHEVHSAQMGVDHALALLRAGSDVAILLDVDGVRIAAMNADPKLTAVNLKTFLNEGGRVIACDHCISMAGLNNKDMLAGVEIDSHPAMPGMQKFLNQDKVIVLDY
jgi:predicted peroxiredoxin